MTRPAVSRTRLTPANTAHFPGKASAAVDGVDPCLAAVVIGLSVLGLHRQEISPRDCAFLRLPARAARSHTSNATCFALRVNSAAGNQGRTWTPPAEPRLRLASRRLPPDPFGIGQTTDEYHPTDPGKPACRMHPAVVPTALAQDDTTPHAPEDVTDDAITARRGTIR